jgi:hypothetical protein
MTILTNIKLEMVMFSLVVISSFPKFLTSFCMRFCMCLMLDKVLFSRGIDDFSLPPPRNVFKFALTWLGGRARRWLCRCPCRMVSYASFLGFGH